MESRSRCLDGKGAAPRHRGVEMVAQTVLRLEAVVVVALVRVDLGSPARIVSRLGRLGDDFRDRGFAMVTLCRPGTRNEERRHQA